VSRCAVAANPRCCMAASGSAIASGKVNGKTKTPSAFLRSTTARELVAELRSEVDVQNLQNDPIKAERGGRVAGQAGGGGTQTCIRCGAIRLHTQLVADQRIRHQRRCAGGCKVKESP
jgi:hypothetical protein